MHNLKAAYINELYKLSKKKKLVVAALLCLAIIAVAAVITCTVNNFMGINLTGNYEFSVMVLPVFLNIVIPLFTIFICIDMFCAEYSSNTMKTALLSPASRLKIFCAKIGAALTVIASMLLLIMFSSFIVSIFIRHTHFSFIKILISYIISMIPLTVICLLAVLVSNLMKGSGSSFLVCVIALLAFKAFEVIYPAASSFFFTSGINMYVLINARLVGIAKVIRLMLISVGYIIMLFAGGFALFESKEI